MITILIKLIIGFLAGVISSMGLGGGSVLILYLVLFTTTPQLESQGINLIFSIPIAVFSIYIHRKNGLVSPDKTTCKISALGIVGAALGVYATTFIDATILTKLFAVFLLFIGLKDLFKKRKVEDTSK